MSDDLRRAAVKSELEPTASMAVERDAINFDFRAVTLPLILITRPDLLKEYLDGGKEKDDCGIPKALKDPTKWKTLRRLFDPCMLAEALYLFELPQTQKCAQHFLTVFQTVVHLDDYDFDGCPNPDIVKAIVEHSRQQTVELDPAGVADTAGHEHFRSKEE